MSADLHIIAFNPSIIAPELVREHTMYSWPEDATNEELSDIIDRENFLSRELYGRMIEDTWESDPTWVSPLIDDVWVGQVSYAKAGFLGDDTPEGRLAAWRRYVPRSVEHIQRVYERAGGIIQITPQVIPSLTIAFSLPHDSMYESDHNGRGRGQHVSRWERGSRGAARAQHVKKWLNEHIGAQTFVDAW